MKKILTTTFLSFLFLIFVAVNSAYAELLPENVAVLANSNSKQSLEVAKAYIAARDIPETNLITFALSNDETITRDDYENLIIAPARQALESRNIASKIRVLTSVFGMPLKIATPSMNPQDKAAGVVAQEALAKSKIDIEENIKIVQKVAGEKQDGFIEVQDHEVPMQFQNLVNRALSKLATMTSEDLQKNQNNLTQAIANIGGLTSIVAILKPAGTPEQQAQSIKEIESMQAEIQTGTAMINELEKSSKKEDLESMFIIARKVFGTLGVANFATKIMGRTLYVDADSSLDSELSLLWWDRNSYPISSALPNPYYHRILSQDMLNSLILPVLMTSRIDAPTAETTLKIISDTIEAEKNGLKGKAYIDTRGLKSESADALTKWDKGLKNLGWQLRDNTDYKVEIDIFPELLGEAKDTAIYVGWYQLRSYKDVFTFNPGSIAWHIASEEAVSIHNNDENGWCKNMLQRGAAVSIGAVAEPFLESFPVPLEFMGLLLSGKYSLVEAYFLTTRNISWRLVLFGDPLYKPFKTNKDIKAKDFDLKEFPTAPSSLPMKNPIEVIKSQKQKIGNGLAVK